MRVAKLGEFNTKDLMADYTLYVTVRHTRQMRFRYWLAGQLLVWVTRLLNVGGYELSQAEPNCDCGRCGYACAYVEPYGFVPEDGCPVHDRDDGPGIRQEEPGVYVFNVKGSFANDAG
jgi:hypothetical protein